jgi:hypothetical protein
MTIKPTVTAVETGRTFEWFGHHGFSGIFDGRHRFDLAPTPPGGTHVIHSEYFSGVLVRLLRKSLDTKTKQGFEEMNTVLKARAERVARTGS